MRSSSDASVVVAALAAIACGGKSDHHGGRDNDGAPAELYSVGGRVDGLSGAGLVLKNNGGDDLPIAADGEFTFATALAHGAAYQVTVATHPVQPEQACTVAHQSGEIAGGNVTGVAVTCTTFSIAWLPTRALGQPIADLWPYGVHGGDHPEGHAGIDFICGAECDAIAVSPGVVTAVDGQNLTIVRGSVRMGYDHVTPAPGIVAAVEVQAGQRLGATQTLHFGLWIDGVTTPVCPLDYFSAEARAELEEIWQRSRHGEELTEPLLCNALASVFPMTAVWMSPSASHPPFIAFTRAAPTDVFAYTYTFSASDGSLLDTGSLASYAYYPGNGDVLWFWHLIFVSDAGTSQLAIADIVGSDMQLEWLTAEAGVMTASAQRYVLVLP